MWNDKFVLIGKVLIVPFYVMAVIVICILCGQNQEIPKLVNVFRSTGAYTQILYKVVSQDVVQFSAIFLVFVVSFSGSLYFALRGEVQTANNDTAGNTTNFTTSLDLYPYETRYLI